MKQALLKFTYLLVVIVLIVSGARALPAQWAKWFPKEKQTTFIPTSRAVRGDLVISVKQLGNIEAERSISVGTDIDGKIIYIVDEGKPVKPGDLLVQLDETPLENNVEEAELNYNNAQTQVEKAKLEMDILKEQNKNDINQAEAQLNYDKAELERLKKDLEKQKRLYEDRLIPQSRVEDAEIKVTAQEFSVQKNENALELKKKDVQNKENQKEVELGNLENNARMAQNRLREMERRLESARVVSTASGLVVLNKIWMGNGLRKPKAGDNVYPRWALLQIPDLSSMLVRVNVDEADIPRVRVGQKVRLTLDALPGRIYSGLVQEVSNLATEGSPWESSSGPSRKNFEVVVKVLQKGVSQIRPGMTANTEIISQVIPKAVQVPIEAVFERQAGQIVFVKNGTSWLSRKIVPGRRNETRIEIKSGLNPGDVVALRDPSRQPVDSAPGEKKPTAKPAPAPAVAVSSIR